MIARFFRSDAIAERMGEIGECVVEAEGFQLTYNALRSVPDGKHIARYDPVLDAWIPENGLAYSDVVVAA